MTMDDVEAALVEERQGPKRKKEMPTGVKYRGRKLWSRFRGPDGEEIREPVPKHITTPRAAGRWRALQMAKYFRREIAPGSRKVTVADALDAVVADYKANRYDTLPDVEQRAGIIREALGTVPLVELTTVMVQEWQATWRETRTPATVNRISGILRRGLNLLHRETPPRLYHVVYVPRLEEKSPRGQRITTSDADAIHAQLPAYLRDPFTFALATGIRRGQLSRTLRRYVDLDGECITWPASETKADEEHPVPLVGEALDVVRRNMAQAVPWCPYLFHGLRCMPGRTLGEWGCLGDFKAAWAKACEAAGVGHRRWHDTRVTAATELPPPASLRAIAWCSAAGRPAACSTATTWATRRRSGRGSPQLVSSGAGWSRSAAPGGRRDLLALHDRPLHGRHSPGWRDSPERLRP